MQNKMTALTDLMLFGNLCLKTQSLGIMYSFSLITDAIEDSKGLHLNGFNVSRITITSKEPCNEMFY